MKPAACNGKIFFQEQQPSYIVISSVIGKNCQLKPITKTKRIKVLPIIPETEWLFKPTEVTPLLFSHSGKPYTSKKLNRIWESANKKANIEYSVPIVNVYNSLRHSFACQRLNQGFSVDKVSTVLGHTSTQMTKRYAQYTVDKLGDVYMLHDSGRGYLASAGFNYSPSKVWCSIFRYQEAESTKYSSVSLRER